MMKDLKLNSIWQLMLFSISFLMCCNSDKNPKAEIMRTSKKFLMSISERDSTQFKKLIGIRKFNITSVNDELLLDKMEKCEIFFNKFLPTNNFKIIITDKYDELSRRLVEVPIFKGYDSSSKLMDAKLIIFFGPPQIIPLSKVSDFELVCEYDNGHGGTYPFPPPN